MTADSSEHREPKVQMNVRIPESLRDAVDARRAPLGMTRDNWVSNALELALRQPAGTPIRRLSRRPAIRRATADRVNGL